MVFRVRLLVYLMVYSALDTAKPEIVRNLGLMATGPGLQDEGKYTLRTSGKVSNDLTEGTTATISNDAGRFRHVTQDMVTSTANTVRDNGGTVNNTVDTVMNSEFTVHNSSTTENISEGSEVNLIGRSISNTAMNNASFLDETTTSDETSTDVPGEEENDVTGTIDRDSYILARKVLIWGFTSILVVVGFACNCITAHALRAMKSSGSSTSYLGALAVSDAAYNLLGMHSTICAVLEDLGYESVRDFNVYAYTYQWIFLHSALNRISSGFTVLLSAERFLAVFFPFYVKEAFITRRPVIVTTVCAIVISALCLLPSFRYEAREVVDQVTGRSRVMQMESQVGRDQRAFFVGYITFAYITFGVIPIFIVFFLNVGIIIKLILNQRKRAKMTSAARGRDHQITRSLLLISMMFVVGNIPMLVMLFIGNVNEGLSAQGSDRYLFLLMFDITFAAGNLNSATNFFILIISSSAFRTSLSAMFSLKLEITSKKPCKTDT